jgi:hypothetical protein
MKKRPEPWHKRHALQLASQLPENHADALLVLQATMELLETFMQPPASEIPLPDNVVPFDAA